jgi:hypothetical protein
VIYWQLTALGVHCDVVAPTLVPVKAGDRVKTDRRDAEKLARCYRAGDLTAVWVPDAAHEALRDRVRARSRLTAGPAREPAHTAVVPTSDVPPTPQNPDRRGHDRLDCATKRSTRNSVRPSCGRRSRRSSVSDAIPGGAFASSDRRRRNNIRT